MNSFTVGLYTAVPDHYPKINFLKKAVSMAIHFKSIWTTFIDVCARYYVSKPVLHFHKCDRHGMNHEHNSSVYSNIVSFENRTNTDIPYPPPLRNL